MKTLFCALSLGLGINGVVFPAKAGEKPAPPKIAKKAPSAPINLQFCPISGEAIKNSGRGGQIVGGYRVQLCCPDCAKTFAKMPAAEKLARVREMAARGAKTRPA